MNSLKFSPQTLQQMLTNENVSSKQLLDPKCAKMIAYLKLRDSNVYALQNNILVHVNKNVTLPHLVYLPKSLVPFAVAYFHNKTHSGVKKMLSLLKLNYFWPGMQKDVAEFVRGCILCSCAKHTNIFNLRPDLGNIFLVLEFLHGF